MNLVEVEGVFAGLLLAIRPADWRPCDDGMMRTDVHAFGWRLRVYRGRGGKLFLVRDDVAWAFARALSNGLSFEGPSLTEALRARGFEHVPSSGAWTHDIQRDGVPLASLTATEAWGWLDAMDAARDEAHGPD